MLGLTIALVSAVVLLLASAFFNGFFLMAWSVENKRATSADKRYEELTVMYTETLAELTQHHAQALLNGVVDKQQHPRLAAPPGPIKGNN
jgi:cytochrome c-type biogenesis protein CcmH/NrfG